MLHAAPRTGGEGAASGFSPTGVDEQPLGLVAEKEEAIGAVEGPEVVAGKAKRDDASILV